MFVTTSVEENIVTLNITTLGKIFDNDYTLLLENMRVNSIYVDGQQSNLSIPESERINLSFTCKKNRKSQLGTLSLSSYRRLFMHQAHMGVGG